MSHSLPLPLDYHTKASTLQPKSASNQSQTGRVLNIQIQKVFTVNNKRFILSLKHESRMKILQFRLLTAIGNFG